MQAEMSLYIRRYMLDLYTFHYLRVMSFGCFVSWFFSRNIHTFTTIRACKKQSCKSNSLICACCYFSDCVRFNKTYFCCWIRSCCCCRMLSCPGEEFGEEEGRAERDQLGVGSTVTSKRDALSKNWTRTTSKRQRPWLTLGGTTTDQNDIISFGLIFAVESEIWILQRTLWCVLILFWCRYSVRRKEEEDEDNVTS